MKKILSVLLVAVMMISTLMLTSCEDIDSVVDGIKDIVDDARAQSTADDGEKGDDSGSDTSEDSKEPETELTKDEMIALIIAAVENTNKETSVHAKMDLVQKLGMSGMTMETKARYDMKLKDILTDNPEFSVELAVSMLGTEEKTSMYCDGEWLYISEGTSGYKMKATEEDTAVPGLGNSDSLINTFPETVFASADIVENADKSITASFTIKKSEFGELYDQLIAGVELGAESLDDVKLGDIAFSLTVADNYVKSYTMSFDMDATTQGMPVTTTNDITMTLEAFGDGVKVTPPAGYKDFPILPGT